MRVAFISTPRSGNTWVRMTVSKALDLEEIAVHNLRDLPPTLPERVALQIHWYREPNLQEFLRVNEFKVVVLARHPLDVLVSVLHFTPREPLTARWLDGNAELPSCFGRNPPASPSFLAYATSWGAENLLSISYQWWHDPNVIRLRYEDIVREPAMAFGHLLDALDAPSDKLAAAINAIPFKVFRNMENRHGWQGTPGLWRKLIPPLDAYRIYRRHRTMFGALNYRVSPYILSKRAALQNWHHLTV